jgi:dihydroxy-acid dehydratase
MGDRIRIDLNKRTADILLPPEELEKRRADLEARAATPTRQARRPGRRSSAP